MVRRHGGSARPGRGLTGAQRADSVDQPARVQRTVVQRQLAAFNSAHVENIVDQSQQIARGQLNFFDAVAGFRRIVQRLGGDRAHPQNRVHRRADFMRHPRQEIGLGRVGLLGGVQRGRQLPLSDAVPAARLP